MIILEGPDGGGKSTLAAALQRLHHGARIIHHGAYPHDRELFPRFLASLLACADGPLILDRSWLSEPIYGEAVRGGEDRVGRVHQRMLERVALGRGAWVLNCLPAWDSVHEVWASRRADEYVEAPDHLRVVYEGYETLPERTCLPVLRYDRDHTALPSPDGPKHHLSLSDVDRELPSNGLIGNRDAPRVVLLGDRSNGEQDLPFVSQRGCSPWLTEQLEQAGVPETDLAWLNVRTPDGTFKDENALAVGQVLDAELVALGSVARAWCEHHGLVHRSVPHPQYWKRFNHQRTYPLLDILMEVL